jgi:hypothetical protein
VLAFTHAARARKGWLTALLALGCSDEPVAKGELGNVTFNYVCSGDSDYQCLDQERGMPAYIGVGAHFDLAEDEVFSSRAQIRPASTEIIQDGTTAFTWRREGYGAMLMFESFGEIEDFVHLKGLALASLRPQLEGGIDVDSVELLDGTDLPVRVIPEARNGAILGGSFDYVWQSEDESIVTHFSAGGANRVRLRGNGPGRTRVSIAVEGVSTTIDVSVRFNPNLPEPLDGGRASGVGPADAAGVETVGRDAGPGPSGAGRLDAGPVATADSGPAGRLAGEAAAMAADAAGADAAPPPPFDAGEGGAR